MSVQVRDRAPQRTGTDGPARLDLSEQSAPTPGWRPTIAATVAVGLASLSLSPLLAGGWIGTPLLMLLVVSVCCGLLAQTRAPLWLVPLVSAAAGLAVMLWAFVPTAPWVVLPSPAALAALRETLQDGLADMERFAAPAPLTPGLLAVVTLGVGSAALVTHVLSVTVRLPVLTIVPLGALYAAPAVVLPDGAPWWSFLFVAAGWLAILLADSRTQVSAWGRVVPRGRDAPARVRPGLWTGPATRIALIGVVLALAVPPIVPGLTDAVFGGRGTGTGPGEAGQAADAVTIDPFVSLRRDLLDSSDVEVFSYTTSSQTPVYLRMVVADSFDGENWLPHAFSAEQADPVSDAVITPAGLSRSVLRAPSTYELRSTKLASPYLPLPYPVSEVNVAGDWRVDNDTGVVFSTSTSTAATVWRSAAINPTPTPAQLRAFTVSLNDVRERGGNQLRSGIPELLIRQAEEITKGRTTPYDQALALQWWFRDNFRYSTNVKGDPSADQLTAFLKDRVGYCQQFAATMALMARALNIQARVAVGFTPGERDAQGTYHVSTKDAHAWPELYFGASGWVRFEPTPRSSAEGGEVSVPSYGRQDNLQADDPTTTPTDAPTADPATAAPKDAAADAAAAEPLGDRIRRASVLTLLALALIAAATPAVLRGLRRRRRLAGSGAALAEGGWSELRDTVLDLGGPWSDAETPRQTAARLGRDGLDDDGSLTRLARATERARYSATPGTGTADVVSDVSAARTLLTDRADTWTRWRARLAPPSVLRRDGRG
jgi:transglutaminase-like putative cysteine protease